MTFTLTPRLTVLALLTLPLAACDGAGLPGLGSEQPQVEGHRGPPTVSPTEAPIETGEAEGRPIATAEARTHNTAAFSARGNEPFWAVDLAGNTAIYKTPSNQRGQAVRVNRLTFAEGVEYVGVLGGRPFVVNIRGTDCQDSMSGERFPMSASLTVSGRSERGCAGPASAEVAQAVAATRAPAPAAPRTTSRPATSAPAATRPASSPATTTAPAPESTSEDSPATGTTTPETTTPPTGSTPAEAPATVTPATPADDTGASSPAGGSSASDSTGDSSTAPAASEPAASEPAASEPAADVPAPTTSSPAVIPTPGAGSDAGADGDDDGDSSQ
ncbi:hypothetical protein SAMN04489859_101381 [Paracoccus alcaliphilus]|uniref:Uncharacterized protein n=1 Tax=Paracoccus alcaliphilus TaxID=34002 RepID=A0A1H8IQK8_9RHOB|nr:hypothetical protein [Paracoccus alcaliphilus]WCR17824.1 hypothetical protein JHW40_16230 [Paracoccus alcaliphilus]SEN70276.1 hypothetical protein SAMN04489859_101381 [Paracoccus alcaliphilus]